MNIWSYILKRVLLMIPTLFGVVAITFAVIQFVPGGPVDYQADPYVIGTWWEEKAR